MSDITTKQLNDVLKYALEEALRLNQMDAHLYNTLGLEHYKDSVEMVEVLEAAIQDMEDSSKMVHQFICPYCHGPLRGVIKVKEKGR